MGLFLRVEVVEAESITKAAFLKNVYNVESNDEKNEIEEGFLIKTENGFSGWISKKDFEAKKYISCNSLPYPLAYYMVQEKKCDYIRLPQWKEDVKIRAQFPDQFSKMTAPYTFVESRFENVPHKTTVIEEWSNKWEAHSDQSSFTCNGVKLNSDGSMETKYTTITSDGVMKKKQINE